MAKKFERREGDFPFAADMSEAVGGPENTVVVKGNERIVAGSIAGSRLRWEW